MINQVGKDLAADPKWAAMIIKPPKALRVDALGESGIDIKITGDTRPGKQWEVAGELRKQVKNAFDKAGIQIPYPHVTIVYKNSAGNLEKVNASGEIPKPIGPPNQRPN